VRERARGQRAESGCGDLQAGPGGEDLRAQPGGRFEVADVQQSRELRSVPRSDDRRREQSCHRGRDEDQEDACADRRGGARQRGAGALEAPAASQHRVRDERESRKHREDRTGRRGCAEPGGADRGGQDEEHPEAEEGDARRRGGPAQAGSLRDRAEPTRKIRSRR